MLLNLSNVIQNPLLIIGVVFVLSTVVYLVHELIFIRQKNKEQKGLMLMGWGILLITIGMVVLFTTTVSFITQSVSGGVGDTYTINEMKKLCTVDKLEEINYILYDDYRESCRIVDFTTVLSYIFFVIGPAFVIAGLAFRVIHFKERKLKS